MYRWSGSARVRPLSEDGSGAFTSATSWETGSASITSGAGSTISASTISTGSCSAVTAADETFAFGAAEVRLVGALPGVFLLRLAMGFQNRSYPNWQSSCCQENCARLCPPVHNE